MTILSKVQEEIDVSDAGESTDTELSTETNGLLRVTCAS